MSSGKFVLTACIIYGIQKRCLSEATKHVLTDPEDFLKEVYAIDNQEALIASVFDPEKDANLLDEIEKEFGVRHDFWY